MIDFQLDPKCGIPFYRQIVDRIRYGISAGQLAVGEQLPTVRALAVQLKVNLNTVIKAYKELEIQKILETHQGTGTFVGLQQVHIHTDERRQKLHSLCEGFLGQAFTYGFTLLEVMEELHEYADSSAAAKTTPANQKDHPQMSKPL